MSESFKTRTSFIMASVGSAVGLGNIFRFPALAVKYGMFFILIYGVLLFLVGIPMLSAELAVGRKFRMSSVGCSRAISAKSEWVGWLSGANSFIILSYYCVLFSLVMLCSVFSYRLAYTSTDASSVFTDFFSSDSFRIDTVLGFIAAWAAVYLCFGKAEKLGKISTASVFFAGLVIFAVALWRGFYAPKQLLSFCRFDGSVLLDRAFWGDVAGQVFFSLSVAVGAMISYGAFLQKKESIAACSAIIGVCDLAVSLMATVIYATVPNTSGDDGLLTCFSVYPTVFSQLGGGLTSALVAFLFYLSLALLCLDSVIAYLKSITHSIADRFNVTEEKETRIVILLSAFFGVFMLGPSGRELLNFADGTLAKFLTLAVALLEAFMFGYVFGTRRLAEEMRIKKDGVISKTLSFSLKILSPVVLLFLFLREFIF